MNVPADLSSSLKPMVEFEVARGNTVVRVDRPAGTRCPLAVIFANPFDIPRYKATHGLPPAVKAWENRDAHYEIEAGYLCENTRHAISGPLAL